MDKKLLEEIRIDVKTYLEKVIDKGMELGVLHNREDDTISYQRDKRYNYLVDEYIFTLGEIDYWNDLELS